MTQFTKLFSMAACCMLLWTACYETDEYTTIGNENSFHLFCSKSAWDSNTRAVTDETGLGNFSENDRIEVRITSGQASTVRDMEYSNGQWTPTLNRSDYGQEALSLSALFPVLPTDGNDDAARYLSLPTDQNSIDYYETADILFGQTEVSAGQSSATLSFGHALHRLCINLKGTIPADLQIEVRSRTEGVISLINGTVIPNDDHTINWITPLKQNATTYTAIILPQDASVYHGTEGLLRLTSSGKSVVYPLNASIQNFLPGMQTQLNLTLKPGEEVDLDFCNQKLWVYGISSPVFPGKENIKTYPVWASEFAEGEWLRYDYESIDLPNEVNYLTWKEGCGWFDCNKTFNYDGDGQMCWAATASNLIHWWLDRNRPYVEAYEKKYGGEPCPKGYRKMTKQDQQHSDVFNFFKQCYPNLGSWETGGVNWFINGDKTNLNYSYNETFPGYFHEVFSKDTPVAKEIKNTSKKNFNQWIKDAFRKNNAIGFSVYGFTGPNGRLHAMTIWGAEFDQEGNVAFIYFCDNNQSEDEPNHGSLRRYKVVYTDSDIQGTYIMPLDYNDGTLPSIKSPVCSVTQVDLRQDIWQTAFPEIDTMNK